MKIRLLKDHKFGQKKVKKGTEVQTDRATGKALIKSKKAEECDFVTMRELDTESKIQQANEEEFNALPLEEKARIAAVKLCSNKIVLNKCLEDENEKIKLAAEKRIEQLSS